MQKTRFIIWFLIAFTFSSCSKNKNTPPVVNTTQHQYAIAIHGGAGAEPAGTYTPEQEKAYIETLKHALTIGKQMLENGDSATDVIVAVISILEDSPLFNAGKGSVLTSTGEIRMDASIMDGKTLDAGAVANSSCIKNPIAAANAIMKKSKYILISGEGANDFARESGLAIEDPAYFYTTHQIESWWESNKNGKENTFVDSVYHSLSPISDHLTVDKKFGTVGCVVLDKMGNLAAGTSTGGLMNKLYGRIGDSPLIGAGTYANNNTCAISCTGTGEDFIKTVAAKTVADMVGMLGWPVDSAANNLIHAQFKTIHGDGGLIAIDRFGNITFSYNSDGMFRGFADDRGNLKAAIYKDF